MYRQIMQILLSEYGCNPSMAKKGIWRSRNQLKHLRIKPNHFSAKELADYVWLGM